MNLLDALSWVDIVGTITGAIVVFTLFWGRRKRVRLPMKVNDSPRIEMTNKVQAERMPGPGERLRDARAKAARRVK